VLTGNTDSKDGDISYYHGGASDMWVVYASALGIKLWERTFGGPQDDYSWCITAGTIGRFIVAGYSNSKEGETSSNRGSYDLVFLNLTTNGSELAPSSWGGSMSDQSTAIIPVGDRKYVVTGHSSSTDGDFSGNHGNGNDDAFIMKLGL